MTTAYIFLKGKASWVRAETLNEWGRWSMMLHPDAESLAIIRDLQTEGVKNVIGKDDDGYFVRLTRPGEVRVRGKTLPLRPPEIFDGSRPLPDGGYLPLRNVLVGNGSDVVVKMEVYDHAIPNQKGKRAKAMRWHSVRVDNLIPFQKKDFDDGMLDMVEGLDQQPKQLF